MAPSRHGVRSEARSADRDHDAELTEVAAPAPARPEDLLRPSLEGAERKASFEDATLGDNACAEAPYEQEKRRDEETTNSTVVKQDHQLEPGRPFTASRFATELYTISWLILFSMFGTLARLGVEAITLYPNSPFPSRVLWANLGGSFFMGFLAEDRQLFRHEWGSPDPKAAVSNHIKVKKTIPLYIGLATGFCGSFTSFSSYIRDCFLALTNALQSPSPTSPYHVDPRITHRNAGFSFLALLAIMIIHPAVSIAALQVGAQFALLLQPVTPTLPFRVTRKIIDPLAVVLGFGCWLGAVLFAIWPPGDDIHWRFRTVMPLVFAPLGCLLRFYASRHMNAIVPSFPLGTFAVNILGTAILGMAYDLQHASNIGVSHAQGCAVLEGVMEGFCGCLTTVSTWVAELTGLRRTHAWIYGATCVTVALSLMIIVMGSMGWTVGFSEPICS
jgi:fluoride exporter